MSEQTGAKEALEQLLDKIYSLDYIAVKLIHSESLVSEKMPNKPVSETV